MEPPPSVPPRYLREPALWLATGLFLGLSPVMPGTIGALWGIPLAYGMHQISSSAAQLVLLVLLCAGAVPICTQAAQRLGKKDPSAIVLDEIMSLLVTYFGHDMRSAALVVAGFVLHRVFDITKPPPVNYLERLPGGLGIMADDIAAGVYSNFSLWALIWLGALGGGQPATATV